MSDEFGLLSSKSGPIPLIGVKVDGDILGRGARVTVSQRFRNIEKTAVEAVYKFPLPEGSAICRFKAQVNGRTIQGQVEEREEAFEIYDDALTKGDGAYLLDEERPNIFTLSVGNLNPGTEAVIQIEYVMLLDTEGKRVRFFLPTTISPRYIPDEMADDNGIPVDEKLHPPYAADVSYGLFIALRIHKGSLLDSVESPTHQVRIENLKGDPINVTLSAESVRMDRDFILYMDFANSQVSRAYQYRTDKESFIQLDFLPEKDPVVEKRKDQSHGEGLKREIVFLVDCSGSMQGDSIQEAKRAVEACIRGLEQGRRFNVVRFGSSHESLFPKAEIYSEKTANAALAHVKNMDADLGGTEILNPLRKICSSKGKERISYKDIILLTDGEVGNESEVFDLIKKSNGRIRVFPVGIGAGCNEYFIKGLGRAGGGASEFIFPGERIEPKVLGLFGKLEQDMITDLAISWGTRSLDQAPALPVAFTGSPVTVFARVEGASIGKSKLALQGRVNGREEAWAIEVVDSYETGLPIPVLWAREKIRDLEESVVGLVRGSRQEERKQNQLKDRIIEISKTFGVLSQSTSYVAVEEREEKDKTTGEVTLRKIPVLLTIGWHGVGRLKAAAPTFAGIADDVECYQAELDLGSDEISDISFELEENVPVFDALLMKQPAPPPTMEKLRSGGVKAYPMFKKRKQERVRTNLLLHILNLQRPEGGMILDGAAAGALGIELSHIHRAAGRMTVRIPVHHIQWMPIDPVLVLSTAILIQILESHFGDHYDRWRNVVGKSRSWLDEIIGQFRPEIDGQDIMSYASSIANSARIPRF